MNKGCFVISLDYELSWGVYEKKDLNKYQKNNIINSNEVVKKIVKHLEQFDVKVTIATVGSIFLNKINYQKLINNIDFDFEKGISSIKYFEKSNNNIGLNDIDDKLHWAGNTIDFLISKNNVEIASHTFSHIFYKKLKNKLIDFSKDDQIFKETIETKNLKCKTIIFPRNEYDSDLLEFVAKKNYTHFRGLNQSFINSNNFLIKKLNRVLNYFDSYINLSGFKTFKIDGNEFPRNIKESFFLRPYNKNLFFLENMKINRIKKSMTYAAKHNEVFHLWWHPHNFGKNSFYNFRQLDQIIKHFVFLKDKYNFSSKFIKDL